MDPQHSTYSSCLGGTMMAIESYQTILQKTKANIFKLPRCHLLEWSKNCEHLVVVEPTIFVKDKIAGLAHLQSLYPKYNIYEGGIILPKGCAAIQINHHQDCPALREEEWIWNPKHDPQINVSFFWQPDGLKWKIQQREKVRSWITIRSATSAYRQEFKNLSGQIYNLRQILLFYNIQGPAMVYIVFMDTDGKITHSDYNPMPARILDFWNYATAG